MSIRLRETISSLWERLEIPQAERELFNRQHLGYKPKVIAAVSDNTVCVIFHYHIIFNSPTGVVSFTMNMSFVPGGFLMCDKRTDPGYDIH